MKPISYQIFLLLIVLLYPLRLVAQESSGSWRDFESVRTSEARLSGYNASGLTCLSDTVQKIAFAEVFANKGKGDFVNYYGSNDSYAFGAQTESFFRLKQAVFYGNIDYLNFTGQNMSGSAWVNPEFYAFDIVEKDATNGGQDAMNSGRKNLEQYRLTGAVGVRLSSRFSVGGKIDYKAANYAKYKDLRHVNTLFDMSATVGAAWQLNDFLNVGANYMYRRNIESVELRVDGPAQDYTSLISFGAFYGQTELSSDRTGYFNARNPMFNQYNGVAIQVHLKIAQNWRFFNEFSYLLNSGYFGRPGFNSATATIMHTENDGVAMAYSGNLSYVGQQNQHSLSINFHNEKLDGYEKVRKLETAPGLEGAGSQIYVYPGKVQVVERNRNTAGLEYTAKLNVQDYCPEWVLKVGGNYSNRWQTVIFYPYYRKQDIFWWNAYLSADRRFTSGIHQYGISLGLLYGAGGGDMNNDGTYAKSSDKSTQPASSDFNLSREYEYLTASRIGANIGCSYARQLRADVRGYVRLNYGLTKASQIEHLEGSGFNMVQISIGCNF